MSRLVICAALFALSACSESRQEAADPLLYEVANADGDINTPKVKDVVVTLSHVVVLAEAGSITTGDYRDMELGTQSNIYICHFQMYLF